MPDFLIVGAQRSGTTSLYRYLTQHPDVLPALEKEVHFFDLQHHRGYEWYASRFCPAPIRGRRYITGEASPYYLFHPRVPALVRAALPDVRLIVILRDPAERALSHYAHSVRQGFEALPLAEALAREPERLAGEAERMVADAGYNSFSHQHHSYLARGHYAEQLRCWQALFPAEQLRVLRFEDLRERPAALMAEVCGFLGLREHQFDLRVRHNEGTPAVVDAGVRHMLRERYCEPNRELERLVGCALGWPTGEEGAP
ncbi:MAG: hypothetical protein RLZZ387_1581 [Chloroflexota bacterium]|jgi:hypothetical protein